MILPLPTNHQPCRLRIGIRANRPLDLLVRGYDPHRKHSRYVVRRVPVNVLWMEAHSNYREFSLPMPLTPEELALEIKAVDGGDDFVIERFKVEKLTPQPFTAFPEVHRFIRFAEWFALEAGELPTGLCRSATGEFQIEYLPVIKDLWGQAMITPARTHRQTGNIQVSRLHFLRYTIPIRVFILLHERMHFQHDTRSEKKADLLALGHYLDLNYPETEAIYAGTKVMHAQTQEAARHKRNRVKDLFDFTVRCQHLHKKGVPCSP